MHLLKQEFFYILNLTMISKNSIIKDIKIHKIYKNETKMINLLKKAHTIVFFILRNI